MPGLGYLGSDMPLMEMRDLTHSERQHILAVMQRDTLVKLGVSLKTR